MARVVLKELLLPIGIDARTGKQLLQQLRISHAGSSGNPNVAEATGTMIGSRTRAQPHVQHVEIDELLLAISITMPRKGCSFALQSFCTIEPITSLACAAVTAANGLNRETIIRLSVPLPTVLCCSSNVSTYA